MIRVIVHVAAMAGSLAFPVLTGPAFAAAPDYDAAMAPYHAAFGAAQNDMAAADRLREAHDKPGTCMALAAAITDFHSAAAALAPVFVLLAGDAELDATKRATLTTQLQQARDAADENAFYAQSLDTGMCPA